MRIAPASLLLLLLLPLPPLLGAHRPCSAAAAALAVGGSLVKLIYFSQADEGQRGGELAAGGWGVMSPGW